MIIQDMILSLEKKINALRDGLQLSLNIDIEEEVKKETVSLINTTNGLMPISHFLPQINELRAEREYQELLSRLESKKKKVITIIEIEAFDSDYFAVLLSDKRVDHSLIQANLDVLEDLGFEVFVNVYDRLEGYPFKVTSIVDATIEGR